MAVKKGNVRLTLSVDPKKVVILKKKAEKAGMTLSNFMTMSACEVDANIVFSRKV